MRIFIGGGQHIDVPDDIFQYILTWCVGGPDHQATQEALNLRLVNKQMKAVVTALAASAWNKPIRNLGLFMVATVDQYARLSVEKAKRSLHETWEVYVLAAHGARVQAYLAEPTTLGKLGSFLTRQQAIRQLGPPPGSRRKERAWLMAHLHRCNTLRLMADPTSWKRFWNESKGEPTRLGRQLLELDKEGYRPLSPDQDWGSGAPWSGFGILLVPRSGPDEKRYLAPLVAHDQGDMVQAKLLLEFFIRKILDDGTLSDRFMLPFVDPDGPSQVKLREFLQLESPHSHLVPSYWPRNGWTHGLERPPGGGGVELFTIVTNPCKPEGEVDIVYTSRWGMDSVPDTKELATTEGGKDVEDLVWTCELPATSSPCQLVMAYLDSAVTNCPYRTVKIEGARLAHGGNMNVGALLDWARGDVPLYDFNDKRYEITQVRVIYSPKRWNAFLKYKSEHEAADLSKIHWAGEQQEVDDFKFPLSFEEGECFLVHGTAFKTMKLIARGGFGPQYCKHRKIGGYGSIGQGTYLTDNLAKISTYANCPGCDTSGAPCSCVDPVDGKPLERVAIISRVFIPKDVKVTTEKKLAYKGVPLTEHPDRAMVIGLSGTPGKKTKWPNNVFLLRHADMAYPELLVYFRWYKTDLH